MDEMSFMGFSNLLVGIAAAYFEVYEVDRDPTSWTIVAMCSLKMEQMTPDELVRQQSKLEWMYGSGIS